MNIARQSKATGLECPPRFFPSTQLPPAPKESRPDRPSPPPRNSSSRPESAIEAMIREREREANLRMNGLNAQNLFDPPPPNSFVSLGRENFSQPSPYDPAADIADLRRMTTENSEALREISRQLGAMVASSSAVAEEINFLKKEVEGLKAGRSDQFHPGLQPSFPSSPMDMMAEELAYKNRKITELQDRVESLKGDTYKPNADGSREYGAILEEKNRKIDELVTANQSLKGQRSSSWRGPLIHRDTDTYNQDFYNPEKFRGREPERPSWNENNRFVGNPSELGMAELLATLRSKEDQILQYKTQIDLMDREREIQLMTLRSMRDRETGSFGNKENIRSQPTSNYSNTNYLDYRSPSTEYDQYIKPSRSTYASSSKPNSYNLSTPQTFNPSTQVHQSPTYQTFSSSNQVQYAPRSYYNEPSYSSSYNHRPNDLSIYSEINLDRLNYGRAASLPPIRNRYDYYA